MEFLSRVRQAFDIFTSALRKSEYPAFICGLRTVAGDDTAMAKKTPNIPFKHNYGR